MLAKETLAVAKTAQQVALGKPTTSLMGDQRICGDALSARADTVGAWEFVIALYFAAATQGTGQHALRFLLGRSRPGTRSRPWLLQLQRQL
jgi:hypothetical protein